MNLISSSPAGARPEGCQDQVLLKDWHVVATTEEVSCGKLVAVPAFPQWDDPTDKKVLCRPNPFRCGYRTLENFVDPTHFPFLHAGVNGILDDPDPIAPYEVLEDESALSLNGVRVMQPYGPRNAPVTADCAYKCLRLLACFRRRVVTSNPARAHEGSDRFCTFFTVRWASETSGIARISYAANFSSPPSKRGRARRQARGWLNSVGVTYGTL
jgi:hypothetical protein